MPFTRGRLVVEALDDRSWMLREPVSYQGRVESFTVPAGFVTDFATVPKILQWIVPRTGRYSPAAVVHDYLCVTGIVARVDADGIFRRILAELGVPLLMRWLMWAAVRFGAREFDLRALGIGLLALPIVGPPTVLAALALGVYTAAEWICRPLGGRRER